MTPQLLPDFPPGPLDKYRKRASFDWKKLKIFLDGEEAIAFEHELVAELEKDPIFYPPIKPQTLDEKKHLSLKRMMAFREIKLITDPQPNPRIHWSRVTHQLDPSAGIKFGINYGMALGALQSLGTERHQHYIDDLMDKKILGCFCLTEIGHGSNAKFMRTTATFDKDTQEFIIHTPDFEAAKCWSGMLGQTATHAVLYAQLITPDGMRQGLHAFFVNIRDTKTLLPLPGITVGDMGEKVGLNGNDNGVLIFNYYRIPKAALLNKTGDVNEEGKYVTPFKDLNKRHGVSMGTLSSGRVDITGLCAMFGGAAVTIGVRYAAVRKQFGPDGQDEVSILEYQTHQNRLLPYLSAVYVFRMFSDFLTPVYRQFEIDSNKGLQDQNLANLGIEMHGVSSACKPVTGWVVRDAIQECREACGGHGYLKAAGLGDLRGDHDANNTYEGENHILIQQTSNWLLKLWPTILKGEKVNSPMKSIDFLSDAMKILKNKFTVKNVHEMEIPKNILDAYQWLVCYLLKATFAKVEKSRKDGLDAFAAKNESQVFYARNLAVAFIQHFFLQRALAQINEAKEPELKHVLTKLLALYGVWSLEKHLVTLYQGGYTIGSEPASIIQESILKLCRDLKDDAVALVDAIAPSDFVLHSVLGKSDGLVYKHLQNSMFSSGGLSRPSWWEDILYPKKNLTSKY